MIDLAYADSQCDAIPFPAAQTLSDDFSDFSYQTLAWFRWSCTRWNGKDDHNPAQDFENFFCLFCQE